MIDVPSVPSAPSAPPSLSTDRMPTLTEVLELDVPQGGDAVWAAPDAEAAQPLVELPLRAVEPTVDQAAIVAEVLAELHPRIDMLFESRLREALAPALARAAELLIREARSELGSALHDLVDDAVKRALQRRGGRW